VGMGNDAGLILGQTMSNEGAWNALRFFREHVGSGNVDFRFEAHAPKRGEGFVYSTGKSNVSNSIASYEGAKAVLVFDTDLSDSLPMLYLRARKAWLNKGTRVFVVSENAQDADSFALISLRCPREKMHVVANYLAGTASLEEAAAATDLQVGKLEAMKSGLAGVAVVTTTELYETKHGNDIALALNGVATAHEGSFNLYARGANEQGLYQMEAYPEPNFLSAREMLKAASLGNLKALWLIDVDPFECGLPREEVIAALENIEFLVVQGPRRNEAFYYASVTLPMALPAECDGSYTNMDGTVQELKAVIPAPGDAKPVWRVFEEFSARVKPAMPSMTAAAVRELIPALR
ncbi:MAG TPA: molybdopterin-dependent oxidoreductase, partial [Fimbriimonas sp.]|nr:molybdopterin-dependent oxidoreductase [Fimbriimonas sp.]